MNIYIYIYSSDQLTMWVSRLKSSIWGSSSGLLRDCTLTQWLAVFSWLARHSARLDPAPLTAHLLHFATVPTHSPRANNLFVYAINRIHTTRVLRQCLSKIPADATRRRVYVQSVNASVRPQLCLHAVCISKLVYIHELSTQQQREGAHAALGVGIEDEGNYWQLESVTLYNNDPLLDH